MSPMTFARRTSVWVGLSCAMAASGCGPTDDQINPQRGLSAVMLGREQTVPFLVRFSLRLLDEDNRAILDNVTAESFRIFENGDELDLAESSQFITPGENLPLKIFLVLDYTNSMRAASRLEEMIAAAAGFLDADTGCTSSPAPVSPDPLDPGEPARPSVVPAGAVSEACHAAGGDDPDIAGTPPPLPRFNETHRIGIIEFHDRTDLDQGFSVVQDLTVTGCAGKAELRSAIPTADALESGLTRVWDAVFLAIQLLRSTEQNIGEHLAVVFMTDGNDTTSDTSVNNLIAAAQANRRVHLYPVSFQDDPGLKATLQRIADETGATFYEASDEQLLNVFNQIATDLRGQYNLTYVTQRNQGTVPVMIVFEYRGDTTTFSDIVDATAIRGNIHVGRINVVGPLEQGESPRASSTFVLTAEYIPRSISVFRFELPIGAQFELQDGGAITSKNNCWTVAEVESGVFELQAPIDGTGQPIPLQYGTFGVIGQVTVPGEVDRLPIEHDDTAYADLPQSKSMVFVGQNADLMFYSVGVTVVPTDAGDVTVSPAKPFYRDGEVVTLTAVPGDNATFVGWSADGLPDEPTVQIAMTQNLTVIAQFEVAPDDCTTPECTPDGNTTGQGDPVRGCGATGAAPVAAMVLGLLMVGRLRRRARLTTRRLR